MKVPGNSSIKARLFIGAILIAISSCAFAQELPWLRTYSIEIGTGYRPLHMALYPTSAEEEAYAELGQSVYMGDARYPVFSLSGAMRASRRSEYVIAAGVSWCHHQLTQYSTFGIDPDGKPRYDLNDGKPAGWANSKPFATLTFRYRQIWTPGSAVELYTGVGMGLSSRTSFIPLPDITPIGARCGWEHLYFYLECTFSPVASFGHGGLGWRF